MALIKKDVQVNNLPGKVDVCDVIAFAEWVGSNYLRLSDCWAQCKDESRTGQWCVSTEWLLHTFLNRIENDFQNP